MAHPNILTLYSATLTSIPIISNNLFVESILDLLYKLMSCKAVHSLSQPYISKLFS